jgi:hypothetical protein
MIIQPPSDELPSDRTRRATAVDEQDPAPFVVFRRTTNGRSGFTPWQNARMGAVRCGGVISVARSRTDAARLMRYEKSALPWSRWKVVMMRISQFLR